MDFEFFAFLVYMSFVSFAIAFLAYAMVVRCMGKESFASRLAQVILVPACVIIYDFITFAAPSQYRYWIASVPLLLVAAIAIYVRFIKGESLSEEKTPTELAQSLKDEPKKFSKKSQRIHEARRKRGRE